MTWDSWRQRILSDRRTFVIELARLWAWFGLPAGLCLGITNAASRDLANHPAWEKLLIVLACAVFGPPVSCIIGVIWAFAMWHTKPLWQVTQQASEGSPEERVSRLEERFSDLEGRREQA